MAEQADMAERIDKLEQRLVEMEQKHAILTSLCTVTQELADGLAIEAARQRSRRDAAQRMCARRHSATGPDALHTRNE
jgi:hypothetical protein